MLVQSENSAIASNANIIPIPCFSVIGSFNIKEAKSIVIIGYSAVIVTTTETLPLTREYTKNNVPTTPAIPVKIAKVTPLVWNSGLNPTLNNRIIVTIK